MDWIVVRHGESEGNALGRMQGRLDSPLSEKGRGQARLLGQWLAAIGIEWDAAYTSPLRRARQTAELIAEGRDLPAPVDDPDLREIHAGQLEGRNREEMEAAFPGFLSRPITLLGDFSEYGGESYDDVQARVASVYHRLEARHRETEHRILLVAHGGFNFQLVKAVACVPVPRVSILRWGNCTATLLRFRNRRGAYMAEIIWHVPLELLGGGSSEGSSGLFR